MRPVIVAYSFPMVESNDLHTIVFAPIRNSYKTFASLELL